MYTPKQFAVDDTAVVEMLAAGGLAYLVTPGPDGLAVTALPFIYDAARGTLLGHVARANPHWRACAPGVESVAIFSGPAAYISPMFYETTRETGKVAPTWNYETLTVYGEVHVHDDADWVRANVTALTDRHEAPREQRWAVADAPADFTDGLLRGIVGVELVIARWQGKSKMSQNQPERNRDGVIEGLESSSSLSDHAVAQRMREIFE